MKKIFLLLMLCSSLLICVTGCGEEEVSAPGSNTATGTNTSTGTNGSKTEYTPSELEKNIQTSGAVVKSGDLAVFVVNNNEVAVDMEIEVEYYDKDEKIVGSSDKSLYGVGKKSEIAVEMYDAPKSFDTYKIYVDVEQSEHITYYDQIEMTHNNTKENVVVQVKNNSEEEIEYINVAVVYFKADVPVGIDYNSEYDIKSGRSANLKISHPRDDDYDDVKFDTYKVYINEAYTYEW